MSDHELALTFSEFFAILQTHYINYISVVFAFLVAAYLVAAKLRPLMVWVVIALFTTYALDAILVIAFLNSDVADLQRMMQARVAAGAEDLAFHAAARGDFAGELALFKLLRGVTLLGSYAGAVWFFFYQRAVGRAAAKAGVKA